MGDTWALLSWRQPHHPNGVIEAYYLYFDRDGKSFTDNRVVRGARPQMTYNLTRLGESSYRLAMHTSNGQKRRASHGQFTFRAVSITRIGK